MLRLVSLLPVAQISHPTQTTHLKLELLSRCFSLLFIYMYIDQQVPHSILQSIPRGTRTPLRSTALDCRLLRGPAVMLLLLAKRLSQ